MDIINSLLKTGNKTANITEKLQFIHTVNGDGSKTDNDVETILMWLTLPFYDFCGFRSVAVNSVYKMQFFHIYHSNN